MKDERVSGADFFTTAEERNTRTIPKEEEENSTTMAAGGGGAQMVRDQATPLFPDTVCQEFRSRWDQIQIGFVDEPRHAVEEADHLIADTMDRLTKIFADERKKMEGRWDRGESVSTEDLRVALQRYRSFFYRLLTL